MPTEVILPRVDMDMVAGKVSRWFVEENAPVSKGQVIFEIETSKAAMEIEAPASGIIRDMVGEEGGEIPVGSIVARIYGEGEDYAGPVKASAAAPADVPSTHVPDTPTPVPVLAASRTTPNGVRATPLARRLAREHRVELGQLQGSGPHGRIQHSDVLAHVTASGQAKPIVDARSACSVETRRDAVSALREHGPLHRVWLRQGTGTPLVLVHGFGSDLNSWRPLASSLPSDRSILGIDLPGHGRSPFTGQNTLDDLATALIETLLAEGMSGGIHLIGHSLGAAVAAQAAAQSQLDVRSLVLLSPAGLGPDMNGAFVSGFLRARSEASLAPWTRQLVFDEHSLGPSFAGATLRSRNADITGFQEQIAASLFPDGTQAFSIRHLLGNFDWPVKVIFGAEDRIIPAHHAAGLPGTVAIHLFPATGHMPQLEQRHAVGRLVGELVRSA